MLKSGSLKKIQFYPNLGKNGPGIGYFAFFENLSFVFSKNNAKWKFFNFSLSITNLKSGKLLILELLPKMVLTNRWFSAWFFNSYSRYKTITSHVLFNFSLQVNNFLFRRQVMFRFQDIHVFAFLTIPWFTKSMKSWLVHERGCIFEDIF